MFLAFIHASKYFRSHFVLLLVFSGTKPLANSIVFSKFEAFGSSLEAGGGAGRVVYSGRDGRDSWAWQMKKRTRTVSHSHIPRQYGWKEQAISHSKYSSSM